MPLDTFFKPNSVAIIGASHDEKKIGHIIMNSFLCGFKGEIYPINPKTGPILGKKVYPSILDVPGKIDLAVIAIPAKIVPSVLKECVKKKVKSVIIISGGFSEIGNKTLEKKCQKIIRGTNTRILGPNCLGIFDSTSMVDTVFLSKNRCGRTTPGNIGFVSQSGAVGSTILDWLSEQETGISKFISYGNAIDVTETDLIEYLGSDRRTKVIAVYIEGIKDTGKRFIEVCKKVSKRKPIVVLKAGKSEKGKKAVSSHTGSLAGSEKIYSGAFRQAGIVEAKTWEELFDFARAFSTQPLPKNNRVLIVTDGGGFGVLATDQAEKSGLNLPEPSKKLKKNMKHAMPSYVILNNPVDLTGDATAERYQVSIEQALKSGEYDAIVAITLFQIPTLEETIIDKLAELNKKYKKPIFACAAGGKYSNSLSEKLNKMGVPVYTTPERAVKTMKAMVEYTELIKL